MPFICHDYMQAWGVGCNLSHSIHGIGDLPTWMFDSYGFHVGKPRTPMTSICWRSTPQNKADLSTQNKGPHLGSRNVPVPWMPMGIDWCTQKKTNDLPTAAAFVVAAFTAAVRCCSNCSRRCCNCSSWSLEQVKHHGEKRWSGGHLGW